MVSKKHQFSRITNDLRRFAWLAAAQALAAALWVLLIPGESEHAVLLGYSLRRLALLLPMVLLALAAAVFSRRLTRSRALPAFFADEKKRALAARWLVVSGAMLSGAMLAVFCFYHYVFFFPDVGAFFRLLPLMALFFLVGIELILLVPLSLFKAEKTKRPQTAKALRSPALWITFAVLLAVFGLIEATGMGKQPVRVSIITLGVPLLEGQIWFSAGSIAIFLIAALAWSAIPLNGNQKAWKYRDAFLFLLIWLTAFALWMSLPLPEHNYFAPAVRPPTFEKYPFSDAEQYDYNSLYVLFGALDDFVVSKPLYVSFLSIIHFLVGFDYGRVVLVQTAVLALLPAVGYLIGKELHSRLAGGGLALLLILREANAILASTMANVSNSKLLMSDVPATLIVAVIVLVIIRWCRVKEGEVSHHVFLLGGLTAVLNLMRIQTLALIPFFLVLTIMRYFKCWKKILLGAGIFLLTVSLLLAPIIIRNYSITGVYWLDNPSSSSALYRFILKGSSIDVDVEEAETGEEVLGRNFSVIFTAMRENLGEMVGFILDNFSRNLISTILILPLRVGNGGPFEDLLRMVSPFFEEVYSQPGLLNTAVLLINLAILSVGFSAVWRKQRLAAAMAVLVYLAYNASSSAVRLSGWRFIQPVDWIMLLFFVIGLVEALDAGIRLVFRRAYSYRAPDVVSPQPARAPLAVDLIAGLAFVLFCAFIPLREGLLPDTYPPYQPQAVCAEIHAVVARAGSEFSAEEVLAFCQADTTRVYKGFGFYPRFFKENEGYYSRSYDPFFGRQDYARLVFRLVGDRNGKIYIKTDDPVIPFHDGDVVYALAFDQPKADAQLVIIGQEDPFILFSEPILAGEQTFEGLR